MKELINWSELSRHITGGSRDALRPHKVAKKNTKKPCWSYLQTNCLLNLKQMFDDQNKKPED